jgi:hypothetical protein
VPCYDNTKCPWAVTPVHQGGPPWPPSLHVHLYQQSPSRPVFFPSLHWSVVYLTKMEVQDRAGDLSDICSSSPSTL